MLKTACLMKWTNNTNQSNILVDSLKGDELFLKDNFIHVFQEIANTLKRKSLSAFTPLWRKVVINENSLVRSSIALATPGASSDSLDRVVAKFQGNVGEIFAEKFFRSGLGADWCKPDSYEPSYSEDTQAFDSGSDAYGVSPISGIQIGIQVKNYIHVGNDKVDLKHFRTAGDEDSKLVHTLKAEQFQDYLLCPSQYIFTFGSAEEIFVKSYESRVKFLGPSYIESKGLVGKSGSKCGNWTFFQEIADDLRSYNC